MTWYSVSCLWKTKTPAFIRLWPFLNRTIHCETIKLWSWRSDISKKLAMHAELSFFSAATPWSLGVRWNFYNYDSPRDFSHTNPDADMLCNNVWMTFWHTQCATDPLSPIILVYLFSNLSWCITIANNPGVSQLQIILVYHIGCLGINPGVSLGLPGN